MKDHATLLRASALVFRDHPRARLVCIGGGDENYATEMRALADELGITSHVLWLQPRPDVTAACNAFNALVSSSSFGEGFSNVVAEAMSCGTPCVVTKVGDSAVIVNDERFTVSPSHPGALAAAMSRMIALTSSDMAQLKLGARRRIEENFSIPHLVHRTGEVLHQLVTVEQHAELRDCLNSHA